MERMSTHRPAETRMLLTPEQRKEHNEKVIADFNRRSPVGTEVNYYHSIPAGPMIRTRVTHGCWFLQSGEPVCMVEGIRGCVSIWHVFSALDVENHE